MTAEQRYLCLSGLDADAQAWERAIAQRVQEQANARRSEAGKKAVQEQPRNPDGTLAAKPSGATGSGTTGSEHRTRAEKASATGTNRGAVQRADELLAKRSDLRMGDV